jgi:ribosome-binding protein aMBF1 (putative translation factor)
MTPERLIQCLETIGWSRMKVAAQVGLSEMSFRRYENGAARVPDDIAKWLEALEKAHLRHPAPKR